jgi:UDP-galactose transporter
MVIFGASTAIMSLQPLIIYIANKRSIEDERIGADGFMMTAEALKIILCATVLSGRRAMGWEARVWCDLRHSLAFAVPAAIYLVMNIVKVMVARDIAPPVFQLLASTKILTTAVASCLLLHRHLTPMQWSAMLLLTAGVFLGQQQGATFNSFSFKGLTSQDIPILPMLVMLLNSALSAIAAVYSERVLKDRQSAELSTFATNLHMSSYTLLISCTKACCSEATDLPRPWNFGSWTWAALFNEAANGLCVSALMRHADSIVKNYAFGVSIFATAGLSVPILSYWPQLSFFVGAVLVLMSMYLYASGTQNGHSSNGTNGSAAKKD